MKAYLYFLVYICFLAACSPPATRWHPGNQKGIITGTQPVMIKDLPTDMRRELKDFVLVNGGHFTSGHLLGNDTFSVLLEAKGKTLTSFYLQRFEVSVKEYLDFCKATEDTINWPDTLIFERNFSWSLGSPYFRKPLYPVVGISLEQVNRYISWKNKEVNARLAGSPFIVLFYLPSALEMEYAIRSPTGNSSYENVNMVEGIPSWFHDGNFNRWNTGQLWGSNNILVKDYYNDGYFTPAPVNTYEPNNWGIYNICGNVAEWTSTNTAAYFSRREPLNWISDTCHVIPYQDQQDFTYSSNKKTNDTACFSRRSVEVSRDSSYYVTMGGSWMHPIFYTQGAAIIPARKEEQHPWLGFRVALLLFRKAEQQ